MISTKRDPSLSELTLAEVALNYPQAIGILNRYGLDYSCNGGNLFTAACVNNNLDPLGVWTEIHAELPIPVLNSRMNFKTWNTRMLLDFISQNHHEYIRVTVPEINELLNVVHSVHGADQPEISEIRDLFQILVDELFNHLRTEEEALFPAIRRLTSSPASTENFNLRRNVNSNVRSMMREHRKAGELMSEIKRLCNNYKTPIYACPTFQMAFRMLEEFEQDVIQHIHLENNVLFPKIIQ